METRKRRGHSAPQRGRRNRPFLPDVQRTTFPDSDEENEEETPIVNHHHMQVQSHSLTGQFAYRTSYFPMPLSPEKHPSHSYRLNDDIDHSMDDFTDPFVDAAVDEEISQVLDPSRKRVASVSKSFCSRIRFN